MKVFISYSRPDRTFAERLRSDIVASGTDVLTDSEVLGAGETWDQGLRAFKAVTMELASAALSESLV
jgi:hypothetical protein